MKKRYLFISLFLIIFIGLICFAPTKSIVSSVKKIFGNNVAHNNFKVVELREGSEDGPLVADLLDNPNPEISTGKDYYLAVTLNTPSGNDGFFKVSLSEDKAHGFYYVNIPGQKYTPSDVDSDAFDKLVSFTEVDDIKYGSNNTVYSLKDGILEYSIKPAKMNNKELYASFGFRLDSIAWNPNETNILDVLKISVGSNNTETDSLNISTQINEKKEIYLYGSSTTYNTTRTVPQVGLSFTLNSSVSSPIIYSEIGYKVTYPSCATYRGASFSSTDINSLNNGTYGIVKTSDAIDNGDGTLSSFITIGPGKKEQSAISGFIYNHIVFDETARVGSTYSVTYSDMYYIPYGDTNKIFSGMGPNATASSVSYNYKVFSEDNYIDRTTIGTVNRTGTSAIYNWNSGRDKDNIVKSIQLMGGASLSNNDTFISKYKKTVRASYNITNENANITLVSIPVCLEEENVYKNKLDVKYTAINESGEEFSGTITLTRILGGANKYTILKVSDINAVSIKSIEAEIGYLPVNYYSCGWAASNIISSNMFAAYGYFSDNTVGNRVKNTFEVINSPGQGVSNDLKATSIADSTGESKIVYNNSVQSGESKNSLSVVAGNSLTLKNKKLIPYYVINGTSTNTSIVVNPVLYIMMPKGMSFNNLIIKKDVTNSYFSGRNVREEISYSINNITYLNTLNDEVNIFKVTFDDKNLVIGSDCNEYGDSISLYFDININTTKTMITKVYDFDSLFNLSGEIPVSAYKYTNAASLPVEDKYNINGGLPLGGSRLFNTTLNGISVQRLDAITVDNSISISKIDGKDVDDATRTWDTYDESNQNSISYMGYNTEGEYRIRVQNPSSSAVTNFKMILPIPTANFDPGSAFSPDAYGFNLNLSPKSLSGFNYQYIKVDGAVSDGEDLKNVNYTEVSQDKANAILIYKNSLVAYENAILMFNFKVTKDASVVKGAFNVWKNIFAYKLDNSIINGTGSYVATEVAATEISGVVFVDSNNNSKFDSDEAVKKNVKVVATDSLGRVQFAETDENGLYSFSNVREDNVTVSFSIDKDDPYWFIGENLPNEGGSYNNVDVKLNKKDASADIYTKGSKNIVNASVNRIHVVSYDVNKGSGNAPGTQEVVKNTQVRVATPPSGMILNGAEFIGWSFSPVAVSDDNSSKVDVRAGDNLTVTEDIVLYAVYQNKYVKLTFDYQGADNVPDYDYKYVQAGKKLNVADKDNKTFPSIKKTGYTLWKWEVASGELGRGNAVSGSTTCSFEEDTIIRAVFVKLNKTSDTVNMVVGDKSSNFYDLSEMLYTENVPGFYNYGFTFTLDSSSTLPNGLSYDDGIIKGTVKDIIDVQLKFKVRQLLNNTGSSYIDFDFVLKLVSSPKNINMVLTSSVDGGLVVGDEKQQITLNANVSGLVFGLDFNENNVVNFVATKNDGTIVNIGTSNALDGVATIDWKVNKDDVGTYCIMASIKDISDLYKLVNNTGISSLVVSEIELEKHTVTFDSNGFDISIDDKVYVHDSELGSLPNIKIDGYKFAGWFDENDNVVSNENKVTSDMTLKAKYDVIEYSVKYKSNDVSIDIADKSVSFNSNNLLPIDGFNVDGYTLNYWQLSNGTKVTNDTKYFELVLNDEVDSITLYAVYSANEYIVRYNGMGGSLSVNEFRVKYNNIYGELVTPTLIGSNFKGWYDENNKLVKGSDNYKFSKDTTLTAHWEYKTGFTVKYDTGTDLVIEEKVLNWNDSIIPDKVPTKKGYEFTGWSFDGAMLNNADTYGSAAKNDKLETITLVALFKPLEFVVKYNVEGVDIDQLIVKYNERYGDLLVPTLKGSNFIGWIDEKGNLVNSVDKYTFIKDTVLTAKLEFKSGYKVIFNDESGNVISEKGASWDTVISSIKENIHKDGYIFTGWSNSDGIIDLNSTYGNIVNDDTVMNIVLSPNYSYRDDYKVSFITNSDDNYEPIYVHYDTKLDLSSYVPTRDKHIFKGWSYDNKVVSNNKYYELALKDSVNEIQLVAEWEYDYSYEFIEGDVQVFTENQVYKYVLKIDGDDLLFDDLIIESLELEKDVDYKVTKGSTVITFTDAGLTKLNSLLVGEYEVEIIYKNSKSVIGKIIIEKNNNPNTIDTLYQTIILFIISVLGFISSTFILKDEKID